MKKLLYISVLLLLSLGARAQFVTGISYEATSGGGTPTYTHSYSLSIDHTQVGSSDGTNYSVLVVLTLTNLENTAFSGVVHSTNGYDINFSANNTYSTLLTWEVEYYDNVAGTIIAKVLLPTVSHTTNTVFYMGVGSTSITSFQGGSTGAAFNSSYVGMFPFDGSTLSGADITSYGNSATITGAVSSSSGVIAGCALLSGTNAISIPSSTNYNISAGTISLWVKNTQTLSGNAKLLICRADPNSHNGITLAMYPNGSNGVAIVQVYNNTSNLYSPSSLAGPTINDGSWHFVAFTFNGTSAAVTYVDGSAVYSASISTTWSFNSQDVHMGSTGDPFWQQYSGSLDDVRIMNSAISADQVAFEYNNQKPSSTMITTTLIY